MRLVISRFMELPAPKKIGLIFFCLVLAVYINVCVKAGNDFLTFYETGQLALDGQNVYQRTPTTGMYVFYLPFFSVLMIPFTILPFYPSAVIWFGIKVYGLFKFYGSYLKTLPHNLNTEKKWMRYVPIIICLAFFNNEFRLGQVNTFVFLLIMASFYTLREGKVKLSSFLFTISCIKITPFALAPYFLFKREFKFVGFCFLWGTLLMAVLAALIGMDNMQRLLPTYFDVTSSAKLNFGEMSIYKNMAIGGVMSRIALAVNFNLNEMHQYTLILTALLFLICYASLFLKNIDQKFSDSDIAILLALMLLVSPDTRSAHMVNVLFPVCLIWSHLLKTNFKDRFAAMTLGAFIFTFVICSKGIIGGKNLEMLIMNTSAHSISLGLIFYYLVFKRLKNEQLKL